MSSSLYNYEDIESDSEPEIQVRNSVVNTMNKVHILHEKAKFRHSRDSLSSLHSPVRKQTNKLKRDSEYSDDSDSDEDESDSDHEDQMPRQSMNKHSLIKKQQDEESEQSSIQNDIFKDSDDEEVEVLELDEPLQLVKASDDLSSFEV